MANERLFTVGANLSQNEILGLVAEKRAGNNAPLTPVAGQIFYCTSAGTTGPDTFIANSLYYRNNANWIQISGDQFTLDTTDVPPVIVITETDNKVTLNIDQSSINHSAITNNETSGNPHQVSLAEAVDEGAGVNDFAPVGGKKLRGLTNGTDNSDAVTLAQLNALAAGIKWIAAAQAASVGNVTIASPGATMDGYTLQANDRVLLKDQTVPMENGVYIWTAAAAGMARSTDVAAGVDARNFALTVENGTVNINHEYMQTANPAVVGTHALDWIQFGGANIIAGQGLTKTGSTIDVGKGNGITVNANDVATNGSEIADVTLGMKVGTATHQVGINVDNRGSGFNTTFITATNELAVRNGGIGPYHIHDTAAGNGLTGGVTLDATAGAPLAVLPHNAGDANLVPVTVDGNGVAVPVDNLTITTNATGQLQVPGITGVAKNYNASISFDGSTTVNVNHKLNNKYVTVSVYDSADTMIICEVKLTDVNNLSVFSNIALTNCTVAVTG